VIRDLKAAAGPTALAGMLAAALAGCAAREPSAAPTEPAPAPEAAPESEAPAPAAEAPAEPEVEEAPVTPPEPVTWTVIRESEETLKGRSWVKVTLGGSLEEGALEGQGVVWLHTPPGLEQAPILLGLPGWKFSSTTWEEHADVGALAAEHGFRLALADMHISVYESAFYPETVADFRWCGPGCTLPGARWVGEVVAPWLRTQGAIAGLFGLSTGGRGAVLLAQRYPGIAPKACSMSGTFDLFALPPGGEVQIHQVIYGPREQFPDRWRADDTVSQPETLAGLSALVIHGAADPAVPPAQSEALAAAMEAQGAEVRLVLVPGAGHDWGLWAGQLPSCFAFFAEP
jgi:pimeloyl-ACP methyl ester carboxylesterase